MFSLSEPKSMENALLPTLFSAAALILLIISLVQNSRRNSVASNQEALTILGRIESGLSRHESGLARLESMLRDELGRNREETQKANRENREEQLKALLGLSDRLAAGMREIRTEVETKLKSIQEDNSKKLDEMRHTVDEKLQTNLERRFNESFRLISERLDQVHKGLGEMQTLAVGVGDLKRVLTNVKTRGNLGEIQLGAILEQILSPEQYETNVAVRSGSLERVEYAIKLPGRDSATPVFLPIDSKFPNEDYQRLLDAYENQAGTAPKELETAARQFEAAIKKNAKDIRDKYINPPATTDFAIMFVPTEGLYAEILRRTGLFESLQRDFRITAVGPTNLVAYLSSLQMGFRTLAIEKRSSEVWEILGAVKTEFGKFGDILDKTKKKLNEAANVIESAGTRTRAIERQLRQVQELPADESVAALPAIEEYEDE